MMNISLIITIALLKWSYGIFIYQTTCLAWRMACRSASNPTLNVGVVNNSDAYAQCLRTPNFVYIMRQYLTNNLTQITSQIASIWPTNSLRVCILCNVTLCNMCAGTLVTVTIFRMWKRLHSRHKCFVQTSTASAMNRAWNTPVIPVIMQHNFRHERGMTATTMATTQCTAANPPPPPTGSRPQSPWCPPQAKSACDPLSAGFKGFQRASYKMHACVNMFWGVLLTLRYVVQCPL